MSVHIPPCKDCICFAVCKSKYSEALKTDEPKTVVFATMQVEYDCPLLTNHLAEITRQERGKKRILHYIMYP
jgi:hypothetical protein